MNTTTSSATTYIVHSESTLWSIGGSLLIVPILAGILLLGALVKYIGEFTLDI